MGRYFGPGVMMYALGGALLLPALLSVTCPTTGCMASAAASAEMSGVPTGRSSAFLRSLQSEPVSSSEQCPPCPACECSAKGVSEEPPKETIEPITVQILMLDSQGIIDMVEWNARDYERFTGGRVKVEIKRAPSMPALFEEIENDARSGGGMFDAYYTNPTILGTAAMLDGFMDLTEYVKSNPYADWTDVLLALRTYVTSFEDKIYLVLLDGDTHTLFYRKDVLEAFGLDVPRTWNEYNEVAKAVHGKMFNGIKLHGSCASRIQGDHATYWTHLVLSSITQTGGTSTGSLFDTKDMTPLTGEAVAEMLRLHEEQAKYGVPDEFINAVNAVQNGHMNAGDCVLTYMWGDMFRRSKSVVAEGTYDSNFLPKNEEGFTIHSKLGVAPTPGSEIVMNRETGKLEKCTKLLCPYAKYYDDIGFVNSAPYAANGGWGGAISANAPPEKQKALADFFLWAASRDQSDQYVIPNATLPITEINGQDPFRKSHLDVDKWVAQGFDRELSKQYVESILSNLISKNVVVEARFPKAGEIMSVLDKEVHEYLVRARNVFTVETDEDIKHKERMKVAQRITDQWNQIIRAYDSRGDTSVKILEIYQRLRGVFIPNESKNQLTSIRPFGYALLAIIITSALAASTWVFVKRDSRVVKASQPEFLSLICFGAIIMAFSIIPMGIDDSIASQRGCDIACSSTPWLLAVGFCVMFSLLDAKIMRVNKLMKSAKRFRRVTVEAKDVLLPFVTMFSLNVIFLSVATAVDPLYWERVEQGRDGEGNLESYGRCTSNGKISTVMLGLVVAFNAIALILACYQAYKGRKIDVAYSESTYVAFSVACILQAAIVGVPLIFLSNANPTASYVVRSLLVFVVCMSVLCFIFIPKMTKSFSSKTDDTRFSIGQSSVGSGSTAGRLGGKSSSKALMRDGSASSRSKGEAAEDAPKRRRSSSVRFSIGSCDSEAIANDEAGNDTQEEPQAKEMVEEAALSNISMRSLTDGDF